MMVSVLATTSLYLPCPAIVNNDENICPTLASPLERPAFANAAYMIDHLRQAPLDWRVREEVHCYPRCRGSPSDLHYRMLCPAEPRSDSVAMTPPPPLHFIYDGQLT
jgi:hypothetical protein